MTEKTLDRLMVIVTAAVVGVLVFGVVVALANDSPQRIGSAVPAGLISGLVAAAGVLAVPLLLMLLSHRHSQAVPDPRVPTLAGQRDTLVRGMVDLVPQLPDGLVWQAENVLSKVGVRQVVPDGEPVDPNRHHVVGTEPPADEAKLGTVARTVRPGYADGHRLVVHPKVVVYTTDQSAPR